MFFEQKRLTLRMKTFFLWFLRLWFYGFRLVLYLFRDISSFKSEKVITLKSDSHVKNIFAKLKFSPALFQKIPSFVSLVFQIGNKWILKLQNLFSQKAGWFKTNCTRLWLFVLMITYNMLTQKYCFC